MGEKLREPKEKAEGLFGELLKFETVKRIFEGEITNI
jgi:hypothetical protein